VNLSIGSEAHVSDVGVAMVIEIFPRRRITTVSRNAETARRGTQAATVCSPAKRLSELGK
jgi:hypothetical protein